MEVDDRGRARHSPEKSRTVARAPWRRTIRPRDSSSTYAWRTVWWWIPSAAPSWRIDGSSSPVARAPVAIRHVSRSSSWTEIGTDVERSSSMSRNESFPRDRLTVILLLYHLITLGRSVGADRSTHDSSICPTHAEPRPRPVRRRPGDEPAGSGRSGPPGTTRRR